MHVGEDEFVSNEAGPSKGVERLLDESAGLGRRATRDIDLNDPAPRSVEIGLQPEFGTIAADESIAGVELVQELDDRSILPAEIAVEDRVVVGGPPGNPDDEVLAVLGGPGVEPPLGVVGAFVDEFVLGLLRAEPVVVDLLVEIGSLELVALLWFIVAGIVESLVVLRPGCTGELGPLQMIRQVLRGLHVADLPLLPVGARAGNGPVPPLPRSRRTGRRRTAGRNPVAGVLCRWTG